MNLHPARGSVAGQLSETNGDVDLRVLLLVKRPHQTWPSLAGGRTIAAAASASDDPRASQQSDELVWNAASHVCSAVRSAKLNEAGDGGPPRRDGWGCWRTAESKCFSAN